MIENGKASRPLVSSDLNGDHQSKPEHDLVRIKYAKVQKDSPEFQTVWEGVDQTIAVELSTFNFSVAPIPILSLYDFIMTTFVPSHDANSIATPPGRLEDTTTDVSEREVTNDADGSPQPSGSDKIRVRVKLTRARGALSHHGSKDFTSFQA